MGIFNVQEGLDKYRNVDGRLNEEGSKIFCDRMNKYLKDKEELEDWNKHLKYCQDNEALILTRWEDPTIDELRKEIDRLNKIIDELEKWLKETYNHLMYANCDAILLNTDEDIKKYGYFFDLGAIHDKANMIEIIRKKLQELKEEGK